MRHSLKSTALIFASLLVSAPALAEPVKVEAVIVSAAPNELNVRTRGGGSFRVLLSPSTKIQEDKGLVNKKDREPQALIPGLIIKVEGDQQGSDINASDIMFKERDWRTAVATKAGTQEQFSELRQAIIDGNEYIIQDEVTVLFASGSTAIAPQYRNQLRALAQKAPSFGNYRISILGFADPVGDPAMNERLSLRRAGAVSNYMRQTGLIQPGRVLSPSAMGEGTMAPGEAAPASNKEARRVVVRVVTPKTQLKN